MTFGFDGSLLVPVLFWGVPGTLRWSFSQIHQSHVPEGSSVRWNPLFGIFCIAYGC